VVTIVKPQRNCSNCTLILVIESHPIQYHAPVYRALQSQFYVPTTVIYGSDFSVRGYHDSEFEASFNWDSDLLTGYTARFLLRSTDAKQGNYETTRAVGLRRLIGTLNPEAILLLGYGSRFDRAAIFNAWRLGKPMLFRAETTDHTAQSGKSRRMLKDAVLSRLYHRFSRLLYIGQHSLGHYQRLEVPTEKLLFAPYCVDASSFACDESARAKLRNNTRQTLGFTESDIVFLFSGKISERKGPDLLTKAVKEFPENLRERVALLFLGDGAWRESMQALAHQTPAIRTAFLGFQNQSQLSRYYHAADALVLPSRRSETWGLVVNEALHHGLPCIVSDAVGCAPDLIEEGQTGYTFANDSVASLVEAMHKTVPLMKALDVRNKCRERVSRYSVTEAARGIAEAYWQVTQGR
jgi:glycosyltransferase involved in cell wall biosynthesis